MEIKLSVLRPESCDAREFIGKLNLFDNFQLIFITIFGRATQPEAN